jgi:hypothetical protein
MGRDRLAVALILALLFGAAPAWAQDVAAAEALFNRGLERMKASDFDAGCPALNESYRIDPRPGTLFTLAECEAKRGHVATAATRYGDYLALFARLPADAQAKQKGREKVAEKKRAELSPSIPQVTLTLPQGAPAGTVVKRDDVEISSAALGLSLPTDPGDHVITTQAPGGPLSEQRFSIGRGEKKQITLEVKVATAATPVPARPTPPVEAPPSVTAQPPDEGGGVRRTGAYLAGGVGVAALVVGGVTGGLAFAKKATVDAHCQGALCDHEGKVAADSGRALALVSTVGVGVGVFGIGAAVVLLVTAPHAAKPAAFTAPRRPRAWASPAGRGGAMIGVEGEF